MSGDCNCFRAADAFTYVDTYRRMVVTGLARITTEKERLEELIWSMALVPSKTYAELRAHEDALKFVTEGKEPGTVTLRDSKDKEAAKAAGKQVPADNKELLKEKDLEILDLQNKIRIHKENEHNLQVELVQRNQELARLRRKLSQTYSSLSVAGATGLIVMSVVLFIKFFR